MNSLHGLDIRIEWGKAKVMLVIDKSKASSEMVDVLWSAETCGYTDYSLGRNSVPGMFGDEPLLVEAWERGWNFHAEADEMSNCECCNNDSGNPCPTHG
ncbi:TPA: hypothetical protein OMD73_005232 [Klebsiella pneumoniae]|nr:hypothetical protein [Klebsiella pneumoniae]